jgi:IclR family pca regulon transcriptional regulator
VLLAFQDDDSIAAYLAEAELTRLTEHTITSKAELKKRLRQARVQGYDSAQDELDYGIVSLAVPVFDNERRVAAAINCSTSTTRVSRDELVKTRLPLLQQAAREIEDALRRWPFLTHSLRP